MIKRICVFCGSNPGASEAYTEAARQLGGLIAKKGIELVYGGGRRGLMGTLSQAALENGGTVTGVIPKEIFDEHLINRNVSKLTTTDSMHTRKALMGELADAFIILPGGIGTLEEFAEVFTWAQLGLHKKSFGLLNTNGYYDRLIAFFKTSVKEGFLDMASFDRLLVSEAPERLLEMIIGDNQ